MFNETLAVLNRPDQIGRLIIEPVAAASVALRVTTVVETDSASYTIPKILEDPSADWVDENEAIPTSQAIGAYVRATPAKIAGLSLVSNERARDTDPTAHTVVAQGLARDIARRADRAFFGPHVSDDEDPDYNAIRPSGLEAIPATDLTTITANPSASVDPFIDAVFAAEAEGVTLSAWVTTPTVAESLAKVKTGTGSNLPVLSSWVDGIGRNLLGLPVLTSPHVASGTVWGIDTTRVFTILRAGTEIAFDPSFKFGSDQVTVRATARLAWAFPHTKGIIRIRA